VITRRKSLKMLGILTGLLIWPSTWLSAKAKKIAIRLEKVKKLQKVGGWVILKIKKQEIMFIRVSKTSIRAVDPICTHKKCTVEYSAEKSKIICPCHGSAFNLDGKVVNPPAEKPLTVYPAKISEGRIILTLEND
jgi:Rieske Fe-S protein